MRRIPELDAIRGLAALVIVLHHFDFLPKLGGDGKIWTYAVDLFFLLSGYLITTIILRKSGERGFLWNFYARRGLRIWPIYYLTIFAILMIAPLVHPFSSLRELPYYLTYTQFIQYYWTSTPARIILPLYHTWTLAIEEQFYILWPALLCLIGRRGLVPAVAVLLIGGVVARGFDFYFWILIARADGLLLGALLAGLLIDPPRVTEHRRRFQGGFLIAMAIGPAFLATGLVLIRYAGLPRGQWFYMFNILAINLTLFGLVGLVLINLGHLRLAPLRDRRLCYLGLISYGLYLYHIPLIWLVENLLRNRGLDPTWMPYRITSLLLSFVVAAASWEWLERPILSLRHRFEYGGRSQPEVANPTLTPTPTVGRSVPEYQPGSTSS